MVRIHHLVLAWACLGGLALNAQAQVVRCTDARTGKVTYTDGSCASGTTAHEVEARKAPAELQQEREQAAEALERKQQRLETEATAAEQDARRAAEQDRARAARTAAAAPQPQDYARSPECARSRRNLDLVASGLSRSTHEQELRLEAAQRQMDLDCLGPEGYAEMERARAQRPQVVVVPTARPRPTLPPPRPRLTHCSEFQCFDDQGKGYPRAGPGRLPGPDGTCRSAGGRAPC